MKVSGFWVLLFLLGTAFILFSFSGYKTSSQIPDEFFARGNDDLVMKVVSRKLKEQSRYPRTNKKRIVAGKVNLEDYHPIDPVPSSKASVRPGPIEHGSPLMPYIPKPSPPPGHSKNGTA